LGLVSQITTGNTPSTKIASYFGGSHPFVKPGDLDRRLPIVETVQTLSDTGATNARLVRPGAVLVSCIGNLGKIGIAGKPLATNQQINAVEFHATMIDDRYGYYYCCTLKTWMEQSSSATTVAILNKRRFSLAPIAVAPLAEQIRIANQLDTLLARVQACNDRFDAIPALLKRFRHTVTNAACSGELSTQWRGTIDLKGWKSQTLADVCNSITDGDHQAPPQADSGVPFITISAMNDGKLRLEKASRFVPQAYFDNLKPPRRPARGDLLFSVTGSIGIPAQVNTDEPFTFQRHIAILKPNKSLILSSFIALALGTEAMRTQVIEVATGTAQLTIPLSGIRNFVVNLPPIAEQTEIVRRVEALFALADRIEARCTAARTQAQRLTPLVLAKAFRGELVPQDPNDEPASALLERTALSNTAVAGKNKRKVPVARKECAQEAINL
jgi:type I restriction enzyme S subunit